MAEIERKRDLLIAQLQLQIGVSLFPSLEVTFPNFFWIHFSHVFSFFSQAIMEDHIKFQQKRLLNMIFTASSFLIFQLSTFRTQMIDKGINTPSSSLLSSTPSSSSFPSVADSLLVEEHQQEAEVSTP
jgi:hypothetical protein